MPKPTNAQRGKVMGACRRARTMGPELENELAQIVADEYHAGKEDERNRISEGIRLIIQEEIPEPLRNAMLAVSRFLEG